MGIALIKKLECIAVSCNTHNINSITILRCTRYHTVSVFNLVNGRSSFWPSLYRCNETIFWWHRWRRWSYCFSPKIRTLVLIMSRRKQFTSPVGSPAAECLNFDIEIKTDQYPGETAWDIKDPNVIVIESDLGYGYCNLWWDNFQIGSFLESFFYSASNRVWWIALRCSCRSVFLWKRQTFGTCGELKDNYWQYSSLCWFDPIPIAFVFSPDVAHAKRCDDSSAPEDP